MKLDYLLTGLISGSYIEVRGAGEVDSIKGGFSLELDVITAPEGWDPRIIILICCDNLRLFSAKMTSNPLMLFRDQMKSLRFGSWVNQQREGYITNSDGEFVVAIKAKGFLDVRNGTAFSRTVVLDGFSKLDQHGGIESIDLPYFEEITKTSASSAVGLSTYTLKAKDGAVLQGRTIYPYNFKDEYPLSDKVILSVHTANVDLQSFQNCSGQVKIFVGVEQA